MSKHAKGAASRFYSGSHIARHREWRGLKDTWYDYLQWMKILGVKAGFVAKSPLRIMKGMLEYRWFGSYLAALHMIDMNIEGFRGVPLRVAREEFNAIMRVSTTQLADLMKADRRFGDNKYADKIVLLEQAMSPELLAGFPKLKGIALETYMGLIVCMMDQSVNPHYIDAMESVGLPADSCRLSANAAGVAVCDDFPLVGACAISNNAPCDSSVMNSQLIERRLTVPVIPAEIPMRWEDRDTDEYALSHIKKMIAFIEENTGEKFDEEAFLKAMDNHNREVKNELARYEMLRTPYIGTCAPITMTYHMFFYTFSGGLKPEILKVDKKVNKLLEKACADKLNSFPKARYRAVLWGGDPIYYTYLMTWLYNCWGVLPIVTMGALAGNQLIDTSSIENALLDTAKNFEKGVMRRHLTGGYKHLLECFDSVEMFNADFLILNDDITCKGGLSLTGIIFEQAAERGIPVMTVSNDMFDHRSVTRQDMRKQASDFMYSVMNAQPLDESLLEFDDYKGW